MKILLIEDEIPKEQHVLELLSSEFSAASVTSTHSYQSGLARLLEEEFDLLILDMSLPTYDIGPDEPGDIPRPFGGRQIMREISRKRISLQVVVLTGFAGFGEGSEFTPRDVLSKELSSSFGDFYLGMIYYNPSGSKWKDELCNIISIKYSENE